MSVPVRECGALKNVTILDLTRAVAGPFCTMSLGDLGARVIKVEEADGGDESRLWGPPFLGGESAYYLALNRNKESIVLDLKEESGRAALQRLACASDVLVQNFRPGVVQRLGIDYETLKVINPRLVYASISGFGLNGPDHSRPGYDLIVQAMSGVMQANGGPENSPVKTCFPIADVLAGQFAAQAILAALLEREETGKGNHVEVSLLESLLAAMVNLTSPVLMTDGKPKPVGPNHSTVVPYQVLRCRDASIAVACPNDRIWKRFCAALEQPQWQDDERFSLNENRFEHRDELIAAIELVLAGKDAAEWLQILDQHHVPSGPLLSVAEIFHYPQVQARGTVVAVDHPEHGALKMIGSPMRFQGRSGKYKYPPRLGEDTEALLEELCQTEVAEGRH
jgi:crotonobetainyl-CoA:carnitine CoA-transferase CaiB-like acyl-CoA transferase